MKENLQYGGQAVIEGVMMRSPRYFAVACRHPNGEIVLKLEDLANSWLSRLKWLNRPFLRGTLALLDAMALGIRALRFSADVQLEEQTQTVQQKRINDLAVGSTMIVGLLVGLGLFVALPTALTQLLPWKNPVLLNMLDGVVRITLFIGYVMAVGSLKEIRRVFQYHGAEHKAINAFEAGLPLTMENAKAQSRIHPRCGTSFVMVVLILAIFVFSLTGRPPIWIRIPLHIALLPLVAGIAYEAIKFAGRHKDSRFTRWLLAPGLWSQYITTREPEEAQIEVALRALQAVVEQEQQTSEVVSVA
ncbi:MAG: membrane protein [Armatimonadota bacterium]|nr:MAG: membrane protein [Armatimonadota bacterium]